MDMLEDNGGFIVADSPDNLTRLAGSVIAIGNFDGVHLGHQRLIEAARAMAARLSTKACVLTFEPHPRAFFAPDKPFFLLTPKAEKIRILARLGLDGVHVRRFDSALAGTRAAAFVDDLIARTMKARGVVVGHDFHFGKGREGNPALLAELCAERGIACEIVPVVEESGSPISSSAIRGHLERGEIVRANALLGYRWFVSGEIRHGEKRGRELGFPTANMRLHEGCHLRHGIYAVRMRVDGAVREGVASFGRRPTFDNGAALLETYLFDFTGDLYGKIAEVEFVAWLRGEERFDDVSALVNQMEADAQEARRHLGAPPSFPSMLT